MSAREAWCPRDEPRRERQPRRVGEKTMHPAFIWWWKNAQREHACGHGAHAHMGGGHGHGPRFGGGGGPPDDGIFGGPFGVRRPLRFLAHKLDLTEDQVAELARIIDELKTERAQAEV